MRPLANRSVPLTPYFCVWGSSLFRFDPVCALSPARTIRAAGLRHSADATVTYRREVAHTRLHPGDHSGRSARSCFPRSPHFPLFPRAVGTSAATPRPHRLSSTPVFVAVRAPKVGGELVALPENIAQVLEVLFTCAPKLGLIGKCVKQLRHLAYPLPSPLQIIQGQSG